MGEKRHVKVLKLDILKPVGEQSWQELGALLRDVRYRVFRLANLAVSEAYLNFHLFRTGRAEEFTTRTVGELNHELRDMLFEEARTRSKDKGEPGQTDADKEAALRKRFDRVSKKGALPSYIADALAQNKIRGIKAPAKWRDVVRGKASLPTFRADMSIPIRCDKAGQRRLEGCNGEVELDLMVCVQPYPRIAMKTGKLSDGARAVLSRLLDNPEQSQDGYRQRCFEVKYEERSKRWVLFVTYDFPAQAEPHLSKERVVGVDLGFACPVYAAINNGHARLGWTQFAALAERVRKLQRQTMARRRNMLRGGRSSISAQTARSGHGRKRKLRCIEQLDGRIHNAYKTLNHQLSAAVVDFAVAQGAGLIQMEDLDGLREVLSGTFLGERWRYHDLQQFIEYKARERGIEVRRVDPKYTSQRCSKCGFIHTEFTRAFRDANRQGGATTRFRCPECEYEADPDYNAARNLATVDIDKLIVQQCGRQGIVLS